MSAIWLVTMREFRERVSATSFRFFSLGLFVMAAAAVIAIDQAGNIFGENEYELGVVGTPSATFDDALQEAATVHDVKVESKLVADRAEAERLLQAGDIDAALDGDELLYESASSSTLTAIVNQAIYLDRLPGLIEDAGITQQQAQALLNPAPANVSVLETQEAGDDARGFIGFLAALILYVTIAVYGTWILTGIVEEKSTRIVEVLLGLLSPQTILTGKTLGILLVALSQLAVALAGGIVGLVVVGTDVLPAVAIEVVVASIPLYILGVLLYSLAYAAVGATVVRASDAQSAATPIVMVLLVPYFYATAFVPGNPDGVAATLMSIFPFTSPLVMPARIANGSPGVVELVLCYGLLPLAIALMAWAGGRIYRGAILSTRKLSMIAVLRAAFGREQRGAPIA